MSLHKRLHNRSSRAAPFVSLGIVASCAIPINHAFAQYSSLPAKRATDVSVRIEGATQGSGVIVSKRDNIYTILTAWHVLKDNVEGEEVSIYTKDDNYFFRLPNTTQKIDGVDLGTFDVKSDSALEVAKFGNASLSYPGDTLFISGFPLSTPTIPSRIFRFTEGRVIGNSTTTQLPLGYQLFYSNQTLPGMSGGPIFNTDGDLIGIHGRGETAKYEQTDQYNIVVKTGTNLGIPIEFYNNISYFTDSSQPDNYPFSLVLLSEFLGGYWHSMGIPQAQIQNYNKIIGKINSIPHKDYDIYLFGLKAKLLSQRADLLSLSHNKNKRLDLIEEELMAISQASNRISREYLEFTVRLVRSEDKFGMYFCKFSNEIRYSLCGKTLTSDRTGDTTLSAWNWKNYYQVFDPAINGRGQRGQIWFHSDQKLKSNREYYLPAKWSTNGKVASISSGKSTLSYLREDP